MSETRVASNITDGDLVRPMVALAWPVVVIQLLQVAYNLADTLWLGRVSAAAVGALSLAFPLIFFLISVGGGFTAGGAILVAQYTGAGGEHSAGKVSGQTVSFVTGIAAVLGVAGFLFTGDMLALLPADPETTVEVVPLAADYMRVFFLGMPFLFGFYVFISLMRGYGNTRTPMRVMFVSVAVNVVLDPLLIFGWGPFPELGIEGAALATIVSRGLATAIGLYVLFGTSAGPTVEPAHLAPDLDTVREIVRIGLPSAAEQSMSSVAMITLTAMVASFAPPVVAAFGLTNRLASLVFLPAMGLGQATNTMVGQNLGAGNPDRAERATWLAVRAAVGVLLVVAVVAAAVPELVVGVFLGDVADAAPTVEFAAEYLRVRSVEFAFIGVFQVLLGAYRGAGNTRTALAFSAVALWLGRVPTVFYLAFVADLGPSGIWVGMAAGTVVGAVAAAAWFTRGTWKRSVVDGRRPGGLAVDLDDVDD